MSIGAALKSHDDPSNKHEMKRVPMKEQWSALFLIIPQSIGSIVNGLHSIDKGYGHSYPVWTYVLIGLWLLIVITASVFAFAFKKSPFVTALQKYWGISSAILALILIFINILDTYQFGWVILLGFFVTPYGILFPLLELCFIDTTSLAIAIVLVFCLLNWALYKHFQKQC